MKKKIYWCIQQLNNIGGTEMVTLQIIRMLENDYEIHLIPFSKIDKEKIKYDLPKSIILEDISFKDEISQLDSNFGKKWNDHHHLKALKLLFTCLHEYTFGRFKWRKKLEKMSSKDDIFVFASQELLLFAPKNRFIVQHFHFNSKLYKSFVSKIFRCLSKKPSYYIFLTDATRKAIDKDNKLPSSVIYNPSRFKRKENFEYHNNTIMSACRFEDQKDPMMLLKVAKSLDEKGLQYTFNIYGNGSMKPKMENFIKDNNLKNVRLISGISQLEPYYLESDLYLITSKFEGFPLTVIEANTLSIPTIWKEMGDPTNSVMKNDVNGYIIDSNDPDIFANKIIELLNDKDKLQSLKRNTYEFAEKYQEENIENSWKELFEKLFKNL